MEFDESKIINSLHTDKAEIGKKYYASNGLIMLKSFCKQGKSVITLLEVREGHNFSFVGEEYNVAFQFLYPYEEEKRMTFAQLAEWLAKGFGQARDYSAVFCNSSSYHAEYDDKEVGEDYKIRYWNSNEWIIPTEEIFLRDCRN